MKKLLLLFLVVFGFLVTPLTNGQIVFRELKDYNYETNSILFLENSSRREYKILNGEWKVYRADDEEKQKTSVLVPSIFEGNAELIFEKEIILDETTLNNNQFRVEFLGLNYSAEILINNSLIYRHPGGEFPFGFTLPKDLLVSDDTNVLAVKIYSELDSRNTIPLEQRFLYPKRFGGIFRDVYLKVIPNTHITDIQMEQSLNTNATSLNVGLKVSVENNDYSVADSVSSGRTHSFTLKTTISSNSFGNGVFSTEQSLQVEQGKERSSKLNVILDNPVLWSPVDPATYDLTVQLFNASGVLVDEIVKRTSYYDFTASNDGLLLNKKDFQINGVTYIPSKKDFGSLMSYKQMETELNTIKDLGFNTVRFSKNIPHPYYLYLCERIGLFAMVEIPLGSVPERIIEDDLFVETAKNYLGLFLRSYKNFNSILAFGLGHSYLGESSQHNYFLTELAATANQLTENPIYASFLSTPYQEVPNLDLYGLELFNISIQQKSEEYKALQERLGKSHVFISSAGYISNQGHTNGYRNKHSLEAQAKYFEDLLTFAETNNISGYVLNTMFDYQGNYHSIVSGYDVDKIIKLGILGEDRSVNRLSYKVIYSKLHNQEKVTIPLGILKNDAPMAFILYGLGLALFMGFLVNSGRKFREDATRALLRPYNFFADIRDQRVISGVQTTILGAIIAAVLALIASSFLYSLKYATFFEKVLVSFGSENLLSTISYLTWHPIEALFWLVAVFFVLMIIITAIIKIISFFVMNKVPVNNAYYTVIWSWLPFVLIIPLAIVLYRIINADIVTLYMYIIIGFFVLWAFYRLLKGIYVIYDVTPGAVYFYTLVFLIIVAGILLFYYQATSSTIDFFLQTINEYKHIL